MISGCEADSLRESALGCTQECNHELHECVQPLGTQKEVGLPRYIVPWGRLPT